MALPEFSMRQLLLEAGAHFGHQTHRWNPKMDRYIFGSRSNIHIIDLSQSIPLLHQALVKVREVAAAGGRVLFVGTKRQASDPVATAAKRCAQYYVNHRWLGGTLTNWRTVSGSIARLRELEGIMDRRRRRPFQEGTAAAGPRARQAGTVAGRHQGHGRHPRHHVRDRHQQGSDRDP
jgi:small subunit ribosomal protein S2